MNYICTIELNAIEPKIWRKFQFHPEITFHQLHTIIQIVMGWTDSHLYHFNVSGKIIGLIDPEYGFQQNKTLNAKKETVISHLYLENTDISYMYDFGDGWEHSIKLVKINSADPESAKEESLYPLCLGGARNCPPEDIGGPRGFQHMLEAIRMPNHPDHNHFIEWLEEDYDPEKFACDEVNVLLLHKQNKVSPKLPHQKPKASKAVKLTKSALNKHLKQMSPDQLRELIITSFEVSKEIGKILAVRIIGEEAEKALFQEYRDKVENEFFPKSGHGKLRLKEAKKAISEFEKFTGNERLTLELMLIYVENGVEFTVTYGDINERFYSSVLSVYADIIDRVNLDVTGELFKEYKSRINSVVSNSKGTGWGFYDHLSELNSELE